jgi:HK97 family phage portal protein
MPATASPSGAGLLTRVVGGLRYAMTGAPPAAWFGPSAPLSPEAPASVAGRQFDYPVGFNLRLQPRQDEGTSFAELRGLADAYDLVRLVIETRKDQVEALDWAIRSRTGQGPDPRIAAVTELLRSPDREHPWSSWVRLLLEDLFVLDAPTLYVRRTAAGGLWGLEVIDGATIKRLLGPDGRTPRAPDPAYQQVLKGVPAVDYTVDELIYAPRNPRPHRVYGYSPVEQILMTVNIGLRRQVSQLNYFTEGNTPEALIGVPEQWTPEQIRQFQEYWDALLEGNLAARRHTRFVPGGLKYQPIRETPLKDEFDEWLARVVCFAFSIPPTAFAKGTNRATAETAQGTALAEGLQPLLVWLKALIDRILSDVLGWPDLEFAWADRTAPDPQAQATIASAYVAAGIKTRNEVRAELGLDPIPGGDTLTTATPAAPLPGGMAKAGYSGNQPRDEARQWADSSGDGPASGSIADVKVMGDPNSFNYAGSQTGAAIAATVLGSTALAAGGAVAAEALLAPAVAVADSAPVFSPVETAGLRQLFGQGPDGAQDLLDQLGRGAVDLPSDVTIQTPRNHERIAEQAIARGIDKIGTQALRLQAIRHILGK